MKVAELIQASKRLGKTQALAGVSLEVHSGEILALLGPNGAGKSTAISLLSGLRRPDSGQALLLGQDPQNPMARQHLGLTPQETGLPPALRVREVIALVQAHYPQPTPTAKLLQRFELVDLAHRQCGGLSGGQKRRLAVALAFAGQPKLVVLDEPTTGLDVESRRSLWEAVRQYRAEGGTVLLTTHYLEEAEALASRVVVIDQGKISAQGSVADIKGQVGLKQVRLQAPSLPSLPFVTRTVQENQTHVLYTANADALVRHLVLQGVEFSQLEVRAVSLEEAFIALTSENKAA